MRDVDAGDQQHHGDRAEQHEERRPRVTHDRLMELVESHRDLRIRPRPRACQIARDGLHRRFRPLARDPVSQSPHHRKIAAAGCIELVGRQSERHPELGGAAGEDYPARHDAHHGAGFSAKGNRASDHVSIGAEAPPPQPLGEHHRLRRPEGVLLGRERAPEERGNAERFEVAGRDPSCAHALRLAEAGEVQGHPRRGGQALEDRLPIPPVEVIGSRHVGAPFAESLPYPHQPVGIAERQGPEQHAIDEAEDRGVGADSKRQRHDHRHRHSARTQQSANGVLKSLRDAFHVKPLASPPRSIHLSAGRSGFHRPRWYRSG